MILGHRGVIRAGAPFSQNTLQAFSEALAVLDGIETDACCSADGEVFLIHDAKYVYEEVEYCLAEHLDSKSRAAAGGRRLDQLTSAEIRSLRLRCGGSIPSLTDALALFRGRPEKVLNLELKGEGVAAAAFAGVQQAAAAGWIGWEQVLISSFDFEALAELRAMRSDIALGMLFARSEQQSVPMFPWSAGSHRRYQPLSVLLQKRAAVQQIKPAYFIAAHTELNEAFLESTARHYPGVKVMVWVFTELEDFDPGEFAARFCRLRGDVLCGAIIDNPENRALLSGRSSKL